MFFLIYIMFSNVCFVLANGDEACCVVNDIYVFLVDKTVIKI